MRIIGLTLALALAAPALAQPVPIDTAVWTDTGEVARPKLVDIAVPRQAGTMGLVNLRAFAPDGLDNGADYRSLDGKVFGTIYIYRPGYPDPSYTLMMTGAAVALRFPGATPGPEELVAVAGTPALHRRSWSGGAVAVEGGGMGEVFTIAGALRAGDWIVKLRATGPAPRRDEVVAAFDGMAQGLRFSDTAKPLRSALDSFSACPARSGAPAARRTGMEPAVLQLSILLALNPRDAKAEPRSRKLCEMGRRSSTGGMELVLSEEGLGYPTIMLLGDSGNAILTIPPTDEKQKGWGLASAMRDQTVMFGPFDRAASADQLLAIMNGGDVSWAGRPISRFARDDKGQFSLEIIGP